MPKPSQNAASKQPKAAATASAFTDTKTLRARARKGVDDGAITSSYTADR